MKTAFKMNISIIRDGKRLYIARDSLIKAINNCALSGLDPAQSLETLNKLIADSDPGHRTIELQTQSKNLN
jgi:hypothetical protein